MRSGLVPDAGKTPARVRTVSVWTLYCLPCQDPSSAYDPYARERSVRCPAPAPIHGKRTSTRRSRLGGVPPQYPGLSLSDVQRRKHPPERYPRRGLRFCRSERACRCTLLVERPIGPVTPPPVRPTFGLHRTAPGEGRPVSAGFRKGGPQPADTAPPPLKARHGGWTEPPRSTAADTVDSVATDSLVPSVRARHLRGCPTWRGRCRGADSRGCTACAAW